MADCAWMAAAGAANPLRPRRKAARKAEPRTKEFAGYFPAPRLALLPVALSIAAVRLTGSGARARLCILFSFERGQELAKSFCTGPFGAFYRRIAIASQSDRKWLAISINLPPPPPRMWVRLLHHEMVSGGLHATILGPMCTQVSNLIAIGSDMRCR